MTADCLVDTGGVEVRRGAIALANLAAIAERQPPNSALPPCDDGP
ncbi:MAG: hypothetical protein ACFB12_26410 [Leptolyngbyaceae cyanobacterium]